MHYRPLLAPALSCEPTLDFVTESYDIHFPLLDLVRESPYSGDEAEVDSATYIGVTPVQGLDCHHLVFVEPEVDWQVWIEVGERPLLRRIVVTHKNEFSRYVDRVLELREGVLHHAYHV